MAVIQPTFAIVRGATGDAGYTATWANMHNGDVGAEVGSNLVPASGSIISPAGGGQHLADFADKSACAVGNFSVGGSVAIEGTIDGSNFWALTTPAQVIIALTASLPGAAVTEAAVSVRPHVTAGDANTLLTVTIYFRKTHVP